MRAAILFCATLAAAPLQALAPPEVEVVQVPDVVTISIPGPAEAQGTEEPIAPTPEERRLRARRLSRSPLAKERREEKGGAVLFALRNRLHAPVSVVLEPGEGDGALVQMLAPARATIPALGRLEVARVTTINALQPGEATFVFTAVVGDPRARHDDTVVYAWPFPAGVPARLTQGPGGPTHFEPHARHAIDLAVAEGTPVLAARAGTVIFLENRYFESGLDRAKFGARANQVRILHEDGSMATYAHLFPASIDVEPGQHVEVGQRIGRSGNTGFSSGPHLHFAVMVHRDMEVRSVPFRMQEAPRASAAR